MWIHLVPLGLIDGAGGAVIPPPPVIQSGGGGGKKRRNKVIRYSDFESRERWEQELRKALPIVYPEPVPEPVPIEEDEDDIVIQLLMMH